MQKNYALYTNILPNISPDSLNSVAHSIYHELLLWGKKNPEFIIPVYMVNISIKHFY